MHHLVIRLFGTMETRHGGGSPAAFPTWNARRLLAFLVLHRDRCVSRERLLGELWRERDPAAARKVLRTCLWRIRKVVEEPGGYATGEVVHCEGQMVGLRVPEDAWVDVIEFEERLGTLGRPGRNPGSVSADDLDTAIGIYRGDLAEELYDPWCNAERERLRLLFLHALECRLEQLMEERKWRAAVRCGRRILHQDPLREHVYRQLIRCYEELGDRPLAIREYQRCASVLDEELGIAPMRETRALYRRVTG